MGIFDKLKGGKKDKVFEDELMDTQSELIALTLNMVGKAADKIFAYCSIEAKSQMFNVFFELDGKIKTLNEMGIVPSRAMELLRTGTHGLDKIVVVDFTWNGMNGNCGVDYLKNFERYELSEAWLKAGFIDIGSFYMESYLVFYDLVTEKVCFIHNEDIMEASVDWDNITNIRTFMLENSRLLGNSFNDFLRTVCTGEPYDDEIIFLGEKSL